ncbi:exported hypothetical protein [Kamptonema sp. PCC 6506]|nr:exported hypothetical protein [Kamptonema sp. PCC 6506]
MSYQGLSTCATLAHMSLGWDAIANALSARADSIKLVPASVKYFCRLTGISVSSRHL